MALTLLFFSTVAVASPFPSVNPESFDTPFTEGMEVLSDSDLLSVTGTGWLKRVGCAAANGIALGGGAVTGAAWLLGTTLPPVFVGGVIVAGVAAGVCFFL